MRFIAIAAVCLVLAACTDADWDNAMSYLPIEHGRQTADTNAPSSDTAAATPAAPVSTAMQPESSAPENLTAPAAADQPTAVAQANDSHCHTVAEQRASDGEYMGMDDDQQKQEYDQTYANCVAWNKAHSYVR